MSALLLILLAVPLCESFLGMGRMQSIAVSGRLTCNGFPAPGIRIKIYDTDILFDSQLAKTYSNPGGFFMLAGHKREFSSIEPRLYIYHRCNYNGPCLKKSEIEIPRQFISEGKTPMVTFVLGEVNLNGRFSDDSVDCIN